MFILKLIFFSIYLYVYIIPVNSGLPINSILMLFINNTILIHDNCISFGMVVLLVKTRESYCNKQQKKSTWHTSDNQRTVYITYNSVYRLPTRVIMNTRCVQTNDTYIQHQYKRRLISISITRNIHLQFLFF